MAHKDWVQPFYQIVDDAAWLERLLPLGLKLVQLRIKDQPEDVLRQQIAKAKQLCAAYQAQLVINDYWQLALELGCDFVHLGQEDLDTADISALQHANVKLGISSHDEDELERALSKDPDYIALGPIYPTILKAMPFGPQGVERISEWKAQMGDLPLVAIGGFKPELAHGAYAAGADCVSVVTDVLLHQNPEARLQTWLEVAKTHG
jgi:thiamine-phosphate pyrophosphorylase